MKEWGNKAQELPGCYASAPNLYSTVYERVLFLKLKKKNQITTTSVFRRTLFLLIMFGFVTFFAVTAKLFQVQMVDYEQYQQKAVSQQTRNEIITTFRLLYMTTE